MYASRQGIWIAAIIVMLSLGAVLEVYATREPSPPTSLGKSAPTLIMAFDNNPRDVVGCMTDDKDAGDLYRQAEIDYDPQTVRIYFLNRPSDLAKNPAPDLPCVTDILNARNAKNAKIFADEPEKVITYHFEAFSDPEHRLFNVGRAANGIGGVLHLQKHDDDAIPYFQAAFALGVHMYDERLISREAEDGMALMVESEGWLKMLSDTNASTQPSGYSAAAQSKFDAERVKRDGPNNSAASKIRIPNPEISGDYIEILHTAPDKVWKIEALLMLGVSQYTSLTLGDRTSAARILRYYANSTDPQIKTAAILARDESPQDAITRTLDMSKD